MRQRFRELGLDWSTSRGRKRLFFLVMGVTLFFLTPSVSSQTHTQTARRICTGLPVLLGIAGLWKGWFRLEVVRPLLLPMAAVFLAILAACTFSLNPGYSFERFFNEHFWFGLLLLVVGLWASTRDRQLLYLRSLVLAACLSAVAGILLYYLKVEDFVHVPRNGSLDGLRAKGLLESPTRSAILYIFMLPATLSVYIEALRHKRRWEAVLCLVVVGLSIWFALLTKTRGPWIGILISVTMFLLIEGSHRYLLAVVAGCVIMALLVLPAERERALTVIRHFDNPDLLLSERPSLWKQGLRVIAQHPFTGVGYGSRIFRTEPVQSRYDVRTDHPQPHLHNLYLQTLAEGGVPLLAAYLWLWGTLLFMGIRRLMREGGRPEMLGCHIALPSLIALLIYGLVDYPNYSEIAHLIAPFLGLVVGGRIVAEDAEMERAAETAPSI